MLPLLYIYLVWFDNICLLSYVYLTLLKVYVRQMSNLLYFTRIWHITFRLTTLHTLHCC